MFIPIKRPAILALFVLVISVALLTAACSNTSPTVTLGTGTPEPAGALPTAQRTDRFEDIITAEQVLCQVAARSALVHSLMPAQFIQHAVIAIECIVSLGKIANFQTGSQPDASIQGFHLAQQHL